MWTASCPLPGDAASQVVTLAHGAGGPAMRGLIEEHILRPLGSHALRDLNDAAILSIGSQPAIHQVTTGQAAALTTDSFVVTPLFFPGGDIGRLAVYGTVNDLAVSGARPHSICLSMILEEGLPLTVLDRVMDSIAEAVRDCGVEVITGDTKVVPVGAADGIYLTTTGWGLVEEHRVAGPASLASGDVLIVSGSVGRHGVAILNARDDLGFDPAPESDCGSLWPAVEVLLQERLAVRSMRDATRGGVTAVLHEWAAACGLTMAIDASDVPVSAEVSGVCELLGIDPLHMANEGTMVIAVAAEDAEQVVDALRSTPGFHAACRIGEVTERQGSPVVIRRTLGTPLALDEPWDVLLPRVC